MVDTEARQFINDLVIAFPQVDEIAKFNSPDLGATHRVWARVLSPFSVDECRQVLNDWIEGRLPPPSAADCKLIAHSIRAIIQRRRDANSKRRASEEIRDAGRNPRRSNAMQGERVAFGCIVGDMRAAYETLRPLHKKMRDGEISVTDYTIRKIEVLGMLG